MSDINIVLENRDDIRVAVEEKDINVEVPAGKDGRSLRPRGEWSASAAYAYLDLVSYEGSSYVATKAVPAGTLPTNTSYWMLSAEKGDPGTPEWGNIAGDLSDQTDLQEALDAKADVIISSASGSIASFTDGSAAPVTALSVSIDPVQDLHGQDAPYPAGGGANIWDEEWEVGGLNTSNGENWNTVDRIRSKNFISINPSTAYYIKYPTAGVAIDYCFYDSTKTFISAGSYVNQAIITPSNAYFMRFATYAQYGSTYHNDIAINYPSTVTTYQPYENICPISGHDTATVTRTGKNLFDKTTVTTGKCLTASGAETTKSWGNYSDYIRVSPNTAYFISHGIGTNALVTGCYYDAYKNYISGINISGSDNISASFTTPSSCAYIRINVHNDHLNDCQLELGSIASAYEPYQAQQVTIDLNGTRYGGELNVLTGEMTVDTTFLELDGTESGWSKWNTQCYNAFLLRNTLPETSVLKGYCSHVKTNVSGNLDSSICSHANAGNGVSFKNLTTYWGLPDDEVSTWTAYLASQKAAGTPIQIVAYLITPFTVQLTPSQMQTLLGTNNIWADTGDVSVEYRADTKRYIDGVASATAKVTRQMIADSATADGKAPKSLATGDLIIVGDELRKATANIGNGSAITASNSTTATLADVIKALQ